MRKLGFWLLCGATLGVYLVIVAWSLPTISSGAGGLTPFDMRPGGYSFDEAQTFLAALTPEASGFYHDVQHRLDIVYPALAALTLFFGLEALLPPILGAWRWLLAAPAALVALFDYLENAAVSALLTAGPGATPSMVAEASQWTVLKSTSTTVIMTAILVLLLWRVVLALARRRLQPTV